MSKIPTNKLSIYLIKDEYSDPKDILKDLSKLQSQEIDGVGVFYFGKSTGKPKWIKDFFGSSLNDKEELFNSTSKGILILSVSIDSDQERIFAIPFGYGWTLINQDAYEQRFGLKVVLNVVDSSRLRRIDKKSMTSVLKDTREQLSQVGEVADFEFNFDQDLINSIAGKVRTECVELFGVTITGKDSLSVSSKIDISNIKYFLEECYDKFTSDNYKKDFGWIDQIAEIRDQKVIKELNEELVAEIKKLIQDDESKDWTGTWMAVPEIIEWSDVKEFVYRKVGKNYSGYSDIFLGDFLESLSEQEKTELSFDTLKKKEIKCYSASNDNIKYSWTAYKCLNCEIGDDERKKRYLLNSGNWYEIEADFVQEIDNVYRKIRNLAPVLNLPEYRHNNENNYNEDAAKQNINYCCMDNKLISYGGGYSKVEFCDLFTSDKKIIHVKHYGGSAVLNHLFSQGVVSGELFLSDIEFRKKVNQKLPQSHKMTDVPDSPRAAEYQIIFAIISSSKKELEIPFFSKLSLKNAKQRLEAFGYQVALQKINVQN